MKTLMTLAVVCVALVIGCDGGAKPESGDDHFHPEASRGGHMIELGDHVAHMEFVHDAAEGAAHFYFIDGKGKAMAVDAVTLKLQTESGPKQIECAAAGGEPKGTHFMVSDTALKGKEPTGRATIKFGGKTYNPDLDNDHDHDH